MVEEEVGGRIGQKGSDGQKALLYSGPAPLSDHEITLAYSNYLCFSRPIE